MAPTGQLAMIWLGVGRALVVCNVATSGKRRARRHADRAWAIRIAKPQTALGQCVNVWRDGKRRPVTTKAFAGKFIRHDDKEIAHSVTRPFVSFD